MKPLVQVRILAGHHCKDHSQKTLTKTTASSASAVRFCYNFRVTLSSAISLLQRRSTVLFRLALRSVLFLFTPLRYVLQYELQDIAAVSAARVQTDGMQINVTQQLVLIDAIEPFFEYPAADTSQTTSRTATNYSKIDFPALETDDGSGLDPAVQKRVTARFRTYVAAVAERGATAITMDDLAHLYIDSHYPDALREKIAAYRVWYAELFQIADAAGLDIFLTTDIVFSNEYLEQAYPTSTAKQQLMQCAVTAVLSDFSLINGVIFRAGEADGVDVMGDFRSEILLRTKEEAKDFLDNMLLLFERLDRTMIFRTWCVGIGEIGDMSWHPETFLELFGDIDSNHFILSSKYGYTDFYRWQQHNQTLLLGNCKRIVELQTRREYEGFGALPNFVGQQYATMLQHARQHPQFVGVSLWTGTGGWSRIARPTFTGAAPSWWNEMNCSLTLRLVQQHALDPIVACRELVAERGLDETAAVELLLLSEMVMRHAYYFEGYAGVEQFFARTHLPALLDVYWDRVTVSPLLMQVYAHTAGDAAIAWYFERKRSMLEAVDEMQRLAQSLDLHQEVVRSIQHLRAFLEVLYLVRAWGMKDAFDPSGRAAVEAAIDWFY